MPSKVIPQYLQTTFNLTAGSTQSATILTVNSTFKQHIKRIIFVPTAGVVIQLALLATTVSTFDSGTISTLYNSVELDAYVDDYSNFSIKVTNNTSGTIAYNVITYYHQEY